MKNATKEFLGEANGSPQPLEQPPLTGAQEAIDSLTLACSTNRPGGLPFEELVELYYRRLYQFAFTLTHSEAEAWDLTQQTFYVWATKGNQLRDVSKVKSWMFTTLHREFLHSRRHETRFAHYELSDVEAELPQVDTRPGEQTDSVQMLEALAQVPAAYQMPVRLFYLEDYPYKDIARILRVPIGTVKSRIARGMTQLRKLFTSNDSPGQTENVSYA